MAQKKQSIRFRTTDEEKEEVKNDAIKHGHDTEGAFLMWLFRRFKRGQRLTSLQEKINSTVDTE